MQSDDQKKVDGYKKGKRFDLIVASIGLGFYLEVQAAKAFNEMSAAAKHDGIALVINTAFRTQEHQMRLYKTYEKASAIWEQGGKHGPGPLAPAEPGFSNHQNGIAVDINRAPGDDPKTAEPDSPVDKWLHTNAAKFGFKQPLVKEPWHWEYVGTTVLAANG